MTEGESRPDNPLIQGAPSSERLEDSSLIHSVVQAIIDNPKDAKKITNSVVQLLSSKDPVLMSASADAERRKVGMWIGAGLSVLCISGGVVLLHR